MNDPLPRASLGLVPIVWNNVDLPDLAETVPAEHVLDEIARLGFGGCQFGRGFPEGAALRPLLESRGLRFAERYVDLPGDEDGPAEASVDAARAGLHRFVEAGGEMFVAAANGSPERDAYAGRTADGPAHLTDAGFRRWAAALDALAAEARELGCRLSFHPHTATWIETPQESARLFDATDAELVGVCLDVGHWICGGGDPVAALRTYGERVTHLHMKDVDPGVLQRLRGGEVGGFGAAIRERLFTEAGNGLLDVTGVLRELAARDYPGWIMVEQDSSWLEPAEASLASKRVVEFALRELAG